MQNIYKQALLADKEGDWNKSHDLVQDLNTLEAAWIHAYLHRKEGDSWNTGYWYKQAQREFYDGELEDEWLEIWNELVDA